MDREDNVLESIFGEGPDFEDVEMLDVEEGEFVDEDVSNCTEHTNAEGAKGSKQEIENKNLSLKGNKKKKKKKKNKNKNRRKMDGSVADVDINRFVIETCRQLKEKKSYMVYSAIGCLGVSALSDLINEVKAIQACGGQMTADGKRQRNGGGILWAVIKTREPNAFREIMKRAKEFEKQFKVQNKATMVPQQPKIAAADDDEEVKSENQSATQSHDEAKRKPVMDRIRVPVSYEDIVDDDVDHLC